MMWRAYSSWSRSNGAAGEGGLQKGDVIIRINDEAVNADARLAELSHGETGG